MKNAVIYYSNTNQSQKIAKYIASKLQYEIFDIFDVQCFEFESLVLVFPIHCQSLPNTVKNFLSISKVQNLTLIATYGRMCHGNVLNEVQKKYKHNIVAGAYVPTRHSYLNDKEFDNFEGLQPIIQKVTSPSTIKIPPSYKNPFSNFFKKRRSQLGVKIIKTDKCNNCGICSQTCKHNAIINGVTNRDCIRCLKCVNNCPVGGIEFKLTAPMRAYLKKKKQDKLVIYI